MKKLLTFIFLFPLVASFSPNAHAKSVSVREWINGLGELELPIASAQRLEKPSFPTEYGFPNKCTMVTSDEIKSFGKYVVNNQNSDTLFPGSVIEAASIRDEILTGINVPLERGTVTVEGITFPKGTSSQAVRYPSHATIKDASDKILEQPHSAANAGAWEYQSHVSDSIESALLGVGVSLHWLGADAQVALENQSRAAHSTAVIKFEQRYYTISWAPLAGHLPVDDSVTVKSLKEANSKLGVRHPPAYISSVIYGRGFLVVATSDLDVGDFRAAINAAMNAGFTSGTLGFTEEKSKKLQRSSMKVIVYGGDHNSTIDLIRIDPKNIAKSDGTSKSNVDILHSVLQSGANWSSATSPADPISYVTKYFDGTGVKVSYVTHTGEEQNCRPQYFTNLYYEIFTGEHDKPKKPCASIRLNDGMSLIGSACVGGPAPGQSEDWGVRYAPNTSQGRFNITTNGHTKLSTDKCKKVTIEMWEENDNSEWNARYLVFGDLEDGTRDVLIADSDMQRLGKGTISFNGNKCPF